MPKLTVKSFESMKFNDSRKSCLYWNGFYRPIGFIWFQCSSSGSLQVLLMKNQNKPLTEIAKFFRRQAKKDENPGDLSIESDKKLDLKFKEGQTFTLNIGVICFKT